MSVKQFILIMTDSQRKDMLGAYGLGDIISTPALDELANSSIMFENAYCAQPVCGPSRSCIFTGTYPHTNGMVSNCMFLTSGTKTVGQRLKSAGIKTGYIGKWHLDGGDYFGCGICPEGWDEKYWYDMRNYIDELTDEERVKSRNFDSCFVDKGIDEDFTYAYRCTNRAIDFIKEHEDESYFLVISYDEPHHPYLAPKEFFEKYYKGNIINKENENMEISNLPEHIRVWNEKYLSLGGDSSDAELGLLGCNAFIDTQIKRVLSCIDESAKSATILYTSDHGESLGSHGIYSKGPAMYEEIANIPFLLKGENFKKGVTEELTVSHVDITPTVLDYFDVEIPDSIEGSSILRIFDKNIDEKVREDLYKTRAGNGAVIEFTRYELDHDGYGGYQPIRAIVKNDMKLVINLMSDDELYDLKKDPQEMKNLICEPEYFEIRNSLHDDIIKWMDDTRDTFRGYYWTCRKWRHDKKPNWDNNGMTRRRHTEKDEVTQLEYKTALEVEKYVGEL